MTRCLTVSLVMLVMFMFSLVTVYGQEIKDSPQKVLKPEDSEQLRQQIQALTELLKTVVPPEKGKTTDSQQQSSGLTMAEVFNKSLDLVSGSIATVSASIEKVAPNVWRIMIRQQYANALYGLVVPFLLLLVGLVYYWRINKMWTRPKEVDFEDGLGVGWVLLARVAPIFYMVIVAIVFSVNIGGAGRIFVNPEYYAIKDLLSMVMGVVK